MEARSPQPSGLVGRAGGRELSEREYRRDERIAIMLEGMTLEELGQFQDALAEEYARRLREKKKPKPKA